MLFLYYSSFDKDIDQLSFLKLLELVPADFQQKILNYKRMEDSLASLYGRLLLNEGLASLGLKEDIRTLRYTRFGRPFLFSNIYFNISHSGSYVVCAISDFPIGVDLEFVRPIEVEFYRSLFCPEEWSSIETSIDKNYKFLYYWTAKEAVLKAEGTGLNTPLKKVKVYNGYAELNKSIWQLHLIDLVPGYVCQIATKTETNKEAPVVKMLMF